MRNTKSFIRHSLTVTTSLPIIFNPALAEETNSTSIEEIIVTGSRIPRAELTQPAPIVSLDAEAIANGATLDLGSILAEMPSIGATDTLVGNSTNGAQAGISSADLRRLGEERTLVLVDGIRHIAGAPGSSQVDLNSIPSILIDRIEIVTGGTSAVYGSDAVSGVINIITKKNFEGTTLSFRGTQATEVSPANDFALDFTSGHGFHKGKGNISFYAGYTETNEVMRNDLQQFDNFGSVVNPEDDNGAADTENNGIPDRITVPNIGSDLLGPTGVIDGRGTGLGGLITFTEDGTPVAQTPRQFTNNGAFGNFPDGCPYCGILENYENYLPGIERFNFLTSGHYEINSSMETYGEVKYISSDITQQFQPAFRFGHSINVADNAYLDDDIRQTLLDEGQEAIGLNKFLDEFGLRTADNDRTSYRIVLGLRGQFNFSETDFDYNVYYNNGETQNTRKTLNSLVTGNFSAATDTVVDPDTGEIRCRNQVPALQPDGYEDPATLDVGNCLPYNPFGLNRSSQATYDWMTADVTREDTITQSNLGATLVFDSSRYFKLPGGPIAFAVGSEYRKETSETNTDAITRSGILANAATPNAYGEYSVTEGYVEVSLPVLADLPFAKSLTLDAAFRHADYDPFGSNVATKYSLIYSPIDSILFRATQGEAVRAPNIEEAFSPQSPGFANIDDPCDSDNINDDEDRVANCAALGLPANFDASDSASIDLVSGGNPNLEPETSDSTTMGIVLTPSFVDNFSLTLDYYEIEIEDAITSVTAQQILDNCVDASGGPDTTFCSAIDRDPTTQNITTVRSGFVNASRLYTEGIEMELRYGLDLESFDLLGSLDISFSANKLLELDIFIFQNRPDEINVEVGELGDPEWQANFAMGYTVNDLRFNWRSRFIDESARIDVTPVTGDIPEDLDPAFVGSIVTHDLSVRYAVNEQITTLVGMRNIFNKLPPGYTDNPLYDLVGRRIYAQVDYRF